MRKALMNLANWPNEDKVTIRANDPVFFSRFDVVLKHSELVEVVKEQL